MPWQSSWQTNMSVLTFNWGRRKRKCAKSDSQEKKRVYSSMEFSTSLLGCRRHLSALTITTTSFRGIELKRNDRMKSFKDSTKARKKRLMSNSRGFSKPKRSSINSTVLLNKLKSTMKWWRVKSLLPEEQPTEQKKMSVTSKSPRRNRICSLIRWMRKLRGLTNRKRSIRLSLSLRRKKQQQPGTHSKKQPLKLKGS